MGMIFVNGVVKKITTGKTRKGNVHHEIKVLDEKEFNVVTVHSYNEKKPQVELNKQVQLSVRPVVMGNDVALMLQED